jgi:hypothetical protein
MPDFQSLLLIDIYALLYEEHEVREEKLIPLRALRGGKRDLLS